jgi:hypothetical protein
MVPPVLLQVRHPHTSLTWDGIRQEICSSFVLMVQASGLELKGQMVPTCIPVPGVCQQAGLSAATLLLICQHWRAASALGAAKTCNKQQTVCRLQ